MAASVHYPQSALIGPGTGTQAAQISIQATAKTRVHNVVVDTGSQSSFYYNYLLKFIAFSVSGKGTVVVGQLVL